MRNAKITTDERIDKDFLDFKYRNYFVIVLARPAVF